MAQARHPGLISRKPYDISGVGQTYAALDLTPNLAPSKKAYHLQKGVGPTCGSYAAPIGYHGVIYNRPFCPCDTVSG